MSPTRSSTAPAASLERKPFRLQMIGILFVLITLALVAIAAPPALLVLLTEEWMAVAVLLGAWGLGSEPAAVLRPASAGPAWFILGSTAFGLGLLSLLALVLGAAGLFAAPLWWGILIGGFVFGVFRVAGNRNRILRSPAPPPARSVPWLILMIVPFVTLGSLCATTPPGVLWSEEGSGYDVLEYHLGVPKEYLANGRITYLPHNVYANFPANVEMLYLWTMVLRGDAIAAMYGGQVLNLGLGVLAVWAVWLAGRELGSRPGVVSALLAGGQGWLVYLSGLAYVENGLLFFGGMAVAAMLRSVRFSDARNGRWALTSGLFAGLSCGCKYSALGLVGAPLLLTSLLASPHGGRGRLGAAGLFLSGCALALAPWLIKNSLLTGDPLFPVGQQWFADYPPGWDAERDSHFSESHRPLPEERPWPARFRRLWQRVLCEPQQRFGTWLWVLVPVAIWVARRDRRAVLLSLLLFCQILVWLGSSHLYARFAVPMLIPLALLVGRLTEALRTRRAFMLFCAVISAGLANNLYFAARLYAEHLYPNGQSLPIHGLDAQFMTERWPGMAHLAAINGLPPGARVLMVGDARGYYFRRPVDYCVVFNRSPFVERVERGDSPDRILAWLGKRGFTHVYVDWAEIERLRKSAYGFPKGITRALFERLQQSGLRLVETFRFVEGGREYGTLYLLPE